MVVLELALEHVMVVLGLAPEVVQAAAVVVEVVAAVVDVVEVVRDVVDVHHVPVLELVDPVVEDALEVVLLVMDALEVVWADVKAVVTDVVDVEEVVLQDVEIEQENNKKWRINMEIIIPDSEPMDLLEKAYYEKNMKQNILVRLLEIHSKEKDFLNNPLWIEYEQDCLAAEIEFEVIADKFGDYLKRYLSEENLLKSNNFTWEVKNFCFNIVEIHFEKE